MTKCILSLDGGGIRSVATIKFLHLLEQKLAQDHQSSLRHCIDFYAGTSAGSIIALALATTNMPVAQIHALFNPANAQKMFQPNRGWLEWDGVNAPKYEGSGKSEFLRQHLGAATIADLPPDKHLLAVSYAIEKRKPEIIKSTDPACLQLKSSEVADASSAAPVYFPSKKITKGYEALWLIDGGVIANNPTMCAVAEARRAWSDLSIDALRVLSVGTGYRTRKINGPESASWGAIGWVTRGSMIDVLMDERLVAYQAMAMLKPGNYIRVNSDMRAHPKLPNPPDDALDDIDPDNIKKLEAMGEFWFEHYGDSAAQLLLNQYHGNSLDRFDENTGSVLEAPWER